MEDNIESSQSDVEQSSGSGEPQASESSAPSQSSPSQEQAQAQNKDENVPFHQHPRFQELISERREMSQKMQQYEDTIRQFQEKMSNYDRLQSNNNKPQEDPLLARLKGIDPEFGTRFEKLTQLESQFEQFQGWQKEQQMDAYRTQAYNKFNTLLESNKVPKHLSPVYERAIKSLAYENPQAGLNDLDGFFKQVHEELSGVLKQERSSYIQDKTKAAAPASTSGGQPASSSKEIKPMSTEDKVKYLASELRAAKQKI